jgi:antitoxin PrlF
MYGTMSSKGQTTIPKVLRDKMNLKPGVRVYWAYINGRAEMRTKTGTLMDIAGMFHDPKRKPLSNEELEDAIGISMSDAGMGRALPPE